MILQAKYSNQKTSKIICQMKIPIALVNTAEKKIPIFFSPHSHLKKDENI